MSRASVASVLIVMIAVACSSSEKSPACGPDNLPKLSETASCTCAEVGAHCTSSAECCETCDYKTGLCAKRSPCNPVTNAPCKNEYAERCVAGTDDSGALVWDCAARKVTLLALCDEC